MGEGIMFSIFSLFSYFCILDVPGENGDLRKRESDRYAEKLKIILRASEKQDELRKQIEASALQEKRIQKKQAAKAVASAKKSTSLADWLNEYGRPKRKPAKEEQFFTFNAGPVGIIPYAGL